MAGLNGFLLARYIVFGLFTICNAITCSVAVWNFNLVTATEPAKVDVYLIFLGALSLVLIITLVFVELLRVNALTTRVWFECIWVALFWVMQLAGATALIAIESDVGCALNIALLHALCTSERMLLAFCWICSIMLLFYLLLLVSIATSQHYDEPKVWVADVRHLSGAIIQPCSSGTPNPPLKTKFENHQLSRSQPVQPLPIPPRTGLSNYGVERVSRVTLPEPMDTPYSSVLREAPHLPPLAAGPDIPSPAIPLSVSRKDMADMRSLSLTHLETPRLLSSSIVYANSGPKTRPVSDQSCSLPSSVFDDWPRQDVMQLPVKPRLKRKPPPSAFEFPSEPLAMATEHPPMPIAQPRARRPSGPRQRTPSGESAHRPAPLNLSGISNYEMGRRDDPG